MRHSVLRRSHQWFRGLMIGVVLALSPAISAQGLRVIERLSGQNVAPIYDGYEINSDGTSSMWFSYFNRNRAEALEVPIGPDNAFEPGPADRGQPTHFVPLWQKSAFRIIVPKDFGDQKLTWHLTSNGKSETVVGTLNRRAIIDRQKETLEGGAEGENLAPKVSVEPMAQAVTWPGKASFIVSATDDGKPQNPATKKPEGLNLRWRKYRGPQTGHVTFALGSAPASAGQKWTTEASFSEPGDYVLQAVVDDSSLLSGTYCCWVNTEVKVSVKAAGKSQQP
jgi:hypothetical protein